VHDDVVDVCGPAKPVDVEHRTLERGLEWPVERCLHVGDPHPRVMGRVEAAQRDRPRVLPHGVQAEQESDLPEER
jgi:hypothetical protein